MNAPLTAIVLLLLMLCSTAYAGEPVPDQFIGRVPIQNPDKLDARARKELGVLAAKIRKTRANGTVKVLGRSDQIESQEEYLSSSVFLARAAETYLRSILPNNYQVYIVASQFTPGKKPERRSVDIYLYPYELQSGEAAYATHLSETAAPATARPAVRDPGAGQSLLPESKAPPVAPGEGGLSAPVADDSYQPPLSKKERMKAETEDSALAEELVKKAKAKAAEKEKRLREGR